MAPVDRRLWRELPEVRRPIIRLGMLGVAGGVLAVGSAVGIAGLVDAVVEPGRHGSRLAGWAFVVVALFAARAITAALIERAAARAGVATANSLRSRVVARLLNQPGDRQAGGELYTLVADGPTSVEPFVARFLPAVIAAAVIPPLAVGALVFVDWPSAAIVVLTLPLLPLFAALIGQHTRAATARRQTEFARLAGHFLDVMIGLPTLVRYGRAKTQTTVIEEVGERHRRATIRTLRIAFLSSAALELLATISVAMVAVGVGLRLATGHVGLFTGLAAILLAPEAYWPIRRVGHEYHAAADGAAAIRALLDVPATERPTSEYLRLSEVGYRYPGGSQPVLADVSWVAAAGLTAITGASGAGKTTMLEIAAGLREPTSGSIQRPAAVHLVTQRPLLVAGTVRENLALSGASITAGPALMSAMRATGLDESVAGQPDGLDTMIGDDGAGLSAGQRAALALTRAWLSDAQVVLLDEPTAHLDEQAAERIRSAIGRLAADRPLVVATHDPLLAAVADQGVAVAQEVSR